MKFNSNSFPMIIFFATLITCSCNNKPASTSSNNEQPVQLNKLEALGGLIPAKEAFNNPNAETVKNFFEAGGKNKSKGNLPVNKPLPATFTDRTFMKSSVIAQKDISAVVGYIVVYDTTKKDYFKVTLTRATKNMEVPSVVSSSTDSLYYSFITAGGTLAAGFASIANINVAANAAMEVSLNDVSQCSVPDSMEDADLIQRYINAIDTSQLKYYYYVTGATLSQLITGTYTSTKFDVTVNAAWVTINSSVYTTNTQKSTERLVSLDLLPLSQILLLKPQSNASVVKSN